LNNLPGRKPIRMKIWERSPLPSSLLSLPPKITAILHGHGQSRPNSKMITAPFLKIRASELGRGGFVGGGDRWRLALHACDLSGPQLNDVAYPGGG